MILLGSTWAQVEINFPVGLYKKMAKVAAHHDGVEIKVWASRPQQSLK
jgi:hypothetical protein